MHETTPDETTADETTPDEGSATAAAGRPAESGETEWQRKRRLAAVFGDVLPDTTSDEQDPESREQRDDAQDRWLRSQVPPHHG